MSIPTQFSYETLNERGCIGNNSCVSPELIFEINELNKTRKKQVQNIFDEVEEIKRKKEHKEIDYVDALTISDAEYERSLLDMNKIAELLSEEHIVELISTRKLFFVYKHILEIFAILLGEGYFEWSHFRTKLNIHEIKYRMMNCNLNTLPKAKINAFLNRIYKNKKLTDDYLKTDLSGIGVIFKWIKAALKVSLYKLQHRKPNISVGNINNQENNIEHINGNNSNCKNSHTNGNFFTYKDNKITKFSRIGNTVSHKFLASTAASLGHNTLTQGHINNNYNNSNFPCDFAITNYKESTENAESEEKIKAIKSNNNLAPMLSKSNSNSGFYLTSILNNANGINSNNNNKNAYLPNINLSSNNININHNNSESTIKEEDFENSPQLNMPKKSIPIIKRICHTKDLSNQFLQQIDSATGKSSNDGRKLLEKYNISALPLLKFKTYHQLRKFFRSDSPNNSGKKFAKINHDPQNDYFTSGTNIVPNELDKFSLRNPKNYEKIINLISVGKIRGIDDETFNLFVENMKMEDYFKE